MPLALQLHLVISLSTLAVAQRLLTDTMTVVLMGCSGLAGGGLACCTLAALKHPITLLLNLQPDVLHEATPYWWIRVAITPLVLLNMTISGILQVYFCKFLPSKYTKLIGICT